MPRYTVLTKFGSLAARGLYHLPFNRLLCGPNDWQPMVPAGTFAAGADMVEAHGIKDISGYEGIFISHSNFLDFPRDGTRGCCGPGGASQNVLDPQTMEPVAFEFADCYSCHYIRFAPGDYELQLESPGEPVCLVACVRHNKQTLLVGAACGRDEREAAKRLAAEARGNLEREARHSSHYHHIVNLPVETVEAGLYLRRLKKKDRPQWLFLK